MYMEKLAGVKDSEVTEAKLLQVSSFTSIDYNIQLVLSRLQHQFKDILIASCSS